MKESQFLIFFSCLIFCISAHSQSGIAEKEILESDGFTLAGKDFPVKNVLSVYQLQQKYQQLKAGDTIAVTFASRVASVCKKKGCWIKVDLNEDQEVMIKFRDYSFFVPKDIGGKQVVINGSAYVSEVSVHEQRHYAEDAGKSAVEIAAIRKPEFTFSFLADGVKIKK